MGELEGLGPEDSFLGLDFSPDGTSIATLTCPPEQEGLCDSVLGVYDAGSGERLAGPIDVGPVSFELISGVAFLPDGSGVVTPGSGPEVMVRDVPTLEVRGEPLDLTDVAPAAGLLTKAVTAGERDGRVLVAALGDFGPFVVWDITDEPNPVGAIESPTNGIWFGPDGRLFVGSVNGPITIYDPLTLEPDGAPFGSDEPAMRFAMTGSGVLAVSSGVGGTMLWDVETGQPLSGDLPSFVSGIDPAGERLYLGAIGWDEGGVRVAVLPLDIDSLVADACLRAGRNLTIDEWRRFMPADSPHRATCPQWPLPDDGEPDGS